MEPTAKVMKQLLIALTTLLIVSCGSNKFMTSSVKPTEITVLNYFKPISYIHYVEKGDKTEFSDSLSMITNFKLDSILSENRLKLRLADPIGITDKIVRYKVHKELEYLVNDINHKKKQGIVGITFTIDSLLESSNERFALVNLISGFGRRKGNYGRQVAKSAAIGLLTLGMYVPNPVKSNITLYSFIFDSQRNEVTFYNRSKPVEKDPTDPEVIEKLLISGFDGYLYTVN